MELMLRAHSILNHVYDFWPNCTPLSAITIIYPFLTYGIQVWGLTYPRSHSEPLLTEVSQTPTKILGYY